jgi:hypothetical protein
MRRTGGLSLNETNKYGVGNNELLPPQSGATNLTRIPFCVQMRRRAPALSGKKQASSPSIRAIGFAPKQITQGYERCGLGEMVVKAGISSCLVADQSLARLGVFTYCGVASRGVMIKKRNGFSVE